MGLSKMLSRSLQYYVVIPSLVFHEVPVVLFSPVADLLVLVGVSMPSVPPLNSSVMLLLIVMLNLPKGFSQPVLSVSQNVNTSLHP